MVQFMYEPTNDSHVRVKQANYAARDAVQSWWELIAPHCDRFFEKSAAFDLHAPRYEMAQNLIDLENMCSVVEKAAYPPQVTELRVKLLSAMSNVLVGFTAAMRGDTATASHHTETAQRQLAQFSAQLDELGVE